MRILCLAAMMTASFGYSVLADETSGQSAVDSMTYEPCNKDLVPHVERSLRNFMVLNPEPIADHPELRRVMFDCNGLPPSVGGYSQWSWGDGTGRAVEAWLGVRQMTGEREFGREVEQAQRDLLFWLLTPETGMPRVPELSHPDQGTYYYHMWDQGRTLRALVRWWLATDDAAEKQLLASKIAKLISSLQELASMREDPRWGPIAEFPYDVFNNGKGEESFAPMSGGQLIEPLAMYWPVSGDTKAQAFAEALCNGVLAAGDASSGKTPNYRFGPDGSFTGHFHNKASIALGVARQGAVLLRHGQRDRGLQLLGWAKKVYDWTLSPTNINQGSTWGWFPETMGDGTQARTVMEICCTADMIELAAVLAGAAPLDQTLAPWDGLWDHVERYTLGAVVPSQFTITPAYAALAKARGGDLNVASRLVGAWAGYHPPNDWVTTLRDDGQHDMLMGCCCNYAGLRALHACWESIFVDDGNQLTIRLPIARRDAAANQTIAEGPQEVRQVVQLAGDRFVRVRIPDWAKIDQVAVYDRDVAKMAFTVEGRYLNLGKLARSTKAVIVYPLETRITKERIGGDDSRAAFTPPDNKTTYTVRWRGNRVVGMDPAGRLLPIFSELQEPGHHQPQ